MKLKQDYLDHWERQRRPKLGAKPKPQVPVAVRRAINASIDAIQTYEVIVGNIGRVYSGPDRKVAYGKFLSYMKDSIDNYGRAAGESVTWLGDGEIIREYAGMGEGD